MRRRRHRRFLGSTGSRTSHRLCCPRARLHQCAPERLRQFALQRKRWSRGLTKAFKLHWSADRAALNDIVHLVEYLFPAARPCLQLSVHSGPRAHLFRLLLYCRPADADLLPLAALWNNVIFSIQRRMFHREGLQVRRNPGGFCGGGGCQPHDRSPLVRQGGGAVYQRTVSDRRL